MPKNLRKNFDSKLIAFEENLHNANIYMSRKTSRLYCLQKPAAWVLRWPFVRQDDKIMLYMLINPATGFFSVAHEVTGQSGTVIY